jgi:hypothetical protein
MKSAATFHRFGTLQDRAVRQPGSHSKAFDEGSRSDPRRLGRLYQGTGPREPAQEHLRMAKAAMEESTGDWTGVGRQSPPMTLSSRSSRE